LEADVLAEHRDKTGEAPTLYAWDNADPPAAGEPDSQ